MLIPVFVSSIRPWPSFKGNPTLGNYPNFLLFYKYPGAKIMSLLDLSIECFVQFLVIIHPHTMILPLVL
jgi:hypothetical protein